MRTALSFAAGALLAAVAGAGWSGCSACSDEPVAPILAGSYALVSPDPAPYVGYTLTYAETGGVGTVHEAYTRNGVAHDTVYTVIAKTP